MADEKIPSLKQARAIHAEVRADEQAARVRDFGKADAATYDARMAEAFRLRAETLGRGPPVQPAVTPAELERSVVQIERQFSPTFDQRLQEAAARMASKPQDKDRTR